MRSMGEGHVPQILSSRRVPLHQPAAGPPPPTGEDQAAIFSSLIASLSSTCPPIRLVA